MPKQKISVVPGNSEGKPSLPDGWAEVRLGDIAIVVASARSRDVILPIHPSVGPARIADRKRAVGQGFAILRPANPIPPGWILHVLAWRRSEIETLAAQAAPGAIPTSGLEGLVVPVAPLVEQRRIVAHLDALETRWTSVRRYIIGTRRNIDCARKTALDVLSGKMTRKWKNEARCALAQADDLEAASESVEYAYNTLNQACLNMAFLGLLEPRQADIVRYAGRSYETAKQLLEKIKRRARRPGQKGRGILSSSGASRKFGAVQDEHTTVMGQRMSQSAPRLCREGS